MSQASSFDPSLLSGPLPLTAQALAFIVLVGAVGRRSTRWWARSFPFAIATAIAAVLAAWWAIQSEGMTAEPVPTALWMWIALGGIAIGMNIIGWRTAGWWRRILAACAVPLCLVTCTLTVNAWVGYARTARGAWELLNAGPLPHQMTLATARDMAAEGSVPNKGVIVTIDSGDRASGFRHRTEYAYLPPAWFTSVPPPALPVVMMIGGAFGTAADWLRAGDAAPTIDAFAARHAGNAPVFVFPDKGGAFNNDTECVNGTRGNAADHLVNDVMPYMRTTFGVRSDPQSSAIAGWSMGGTCAVTLAVKYPETFRIFVSLAGDAGPNLGNRDQTVEKLFGGDERAFASFDPATVMRTHGRYEGMSGVFAVSSPDDTGGRLDSHAQAATTLCGIARTSAINCTIAYIAGAHDWSFGADGFRLALPWLASRLSTPRADAGVPPP